MSDGPCKTGLGLLLWAQQIFTECLLCAGDTGPEKVHRLVEALSMWLVVFTWIQAIERWLLFFWGWLLCPSSPERLPALLFSPGVGLTFENIVSSWGHTEEKKISLWVTLDLPSIYFHFQTLWVSESWLQLLAIQGVFPWGRRQGHCHLPQWHPFFLCPTPSDVLRKG